MKKQVTGGKAEKRIAVEGELFGDFGHEPIKLTETDGCEFDDLFARLAKSQFRSRFHLKPSDIEYIHKKGMETICRHAEDFIRKRLSPASIANDGRQTPMRGHPVFIAQHATGCCCRGCLEKWHGIKAGHELSEDELRYIVSVIMEWIRRDMTRRDG